MMNAASIQLETIINSQNTKYTNLVYRKNSDHFYTFGRGELLDSTIYETNKELVDRKIIQFIEENRGLLDHERLEMLTDILDREIVQITGTLTGLWKYIYRILSLFALVKNERIREEEKTRYEEIAAAIRTEVIIIGDSVHSPHQPSIQNHFPSTPFNQITRSSRLESLRSPFDERRTISTPPASLLAPHRAPPPPPPPPPANLAAVFDTPSKLILLPGETRPPTNIKSTGYQLLGNDLLQEQIEEINQYIENLKRVLNPLKERMIDPMEKLRVVIKAREDELAFAKIKLEDCKPKLDCLNRKIENNVIATCKVKGKAKAFFHMYPTPIYREIKNEISGAVPKPSKSEGDRQDEIKNEVSEDERDFSHDSIDLPKTPDTAHLKGQFMNLNSLQPADPLEKELDSCQSEDHLTYLNAHHDRITNQIAELNVVIGNLKRDLNRLENSTLQLRDCSTEEERAINYTAKQVEALLVEKYKELDVWTRRRGARVQVLDSKNKSHQPRNLNQQPQRTGILFVKDIPN